MLSVNARWWVLLAAIAVLVGAALAFADAGVHITGTLGGPDIEGGYFELVNDAGKGEGELILATPPNSPLYPHFKAMAGHRVQISVFVVPK